MNLTLGLGLPPGGGVAFSPLSVSPVLWLDPSDLSTLKQERTGASATTPSEVDGVVGTMLDKSGNGNHLTAPADASRPILRSAGGLFWLEFDGNNDCLLASFTLDQPYDRVIAARVVAWAANDHLWDGIVDDSGRIRCHNTDVEPNMQANAGSDVNLADEPAAGTDFVLTERWAGASSRFAIDNNSYATGNPGAGNPGGFTLGAFANGQAAHANIRFYGGIIKAGALTDAQIAQLRTYLAAKQGRVL